MLEIRRALFCGCEGVWQRLGRKEAEKAGSCPPTVPSVVMSVCLFTNHVCASNPVPHQRCELNSVQDFGMEDTDRKSTAAPF